MRPAPEPRNAKDGRPARDASPPLHPCTVPCPAFTFPMLRRLWSPALAALALLSAPLRCAEPVAAPDFRRVEVKPTWTSIYIGTVSLQMPPFARTAAGEFESTYSARVLPYFFYNETGRIGIRVSAAALRQLARGETIEFSGHAVNHAGEERPIEGRATPADATSGRLKVRVRVSPRIELIFNTTYRFRA
jgi:hypothetical protein